MRKGWEIKKLGDVCDTGAGGTPLKAHKDYYENGNIPWLLSGEVSQGEIYNSRNYITKKGLKNSSAKLFPINTVLVAMYGATAGQVGILKFEACTNQAVCGILPNEKFIPKYIYYCFLSKKKELIAQAVGGAQPNISQIKIKNTKIPVLSIFEQQEIVSILDDAFESIERAKLNAEQNLKNAKELFDSYLQGVFENRSDDWLKETLEDLLEKEWITSHLDGNHGSDYPKKEEFKSNGVPYISANCIKGTDIDFSLAKYLSPEKAKTFRKGVAKNNDVLFAHNATVGPVALLKTKEEKIILGTSLTYYRCNPKYILPEYLANYMRSKEFKKQYEIIMRQSTRNQVPITKQREFYHLIPPIEFQHKIIIKLIQLLDNTQKLEFMYQQKLNDLDELKKSILQKAFNGELKTSKISA
jgi:type I restriction enzyme S subunit